MKWRKNKISLLYRYIHFIKRLRRVRVIKIGNKQYTVYKRNLLAIVYDQDKNIVFNNIKKPADFRLWLKNLRESEMKRKK